MPIKCLFLQVGNLSTALTFLHKELECPNCHQRVRSPAQQCSQGHVTCSACATTECASCQQPFLKESPILVNKLLDVLPRPCRYLKEGCPEVFLIDDKHEAHCGYRSIWCRAEQCKEKVHVRQMMTHCKEKHHSIEADSKFNRNVKFHSEMLTFSSSLSSVSTKLSSGYVEAVAVYFGVQFFYVYIYNDFKSKSLKILCQALTVDKSTVDYFVNVKMEYSNFKSINTIKPIACQGDDDDKKDSEMIKKIVDNNEEYCVKISSEMLCKLNDLIQFSFF